MYPLKPKYMRKATKKRTKKGPRKSCRGRRKTATKALFGNTSITDAIKKGGIVGGKSSISPIYRFTPAQLAEMNKGPRLK